MYICLGALKLGFKAGCRSMLGLDGCHLKSCYGGQLLTAVGLDANNTTWVLAWVVVEMESKDSWEWFLDLLAKDLHIRDEGAGWTFSSDKQKRLLPAFDSVMPLADHRFCVRHLRTNFNKLFPGKVMKDQLWACAKATNENFFAKEMILMSQLNPKAWDCLMHPNKPSKHWCRAYFRTHLKCDVLLNNLSESFNAFIVPARKKPIVSCFEEIRVKLMRRIHVRRDKMMKHEDTICPKPRELLEKNKNNTSKKGPLSTNDLRKKIQLKAQRLKEKRDLKKAEQAAAAAKKSNVSRGSNGRSATTSRPSAATTTMSSVTTSTPAISRATALTPTRVNPHPKPSSSRQATSTRSSTRIRSTDGKR